MNSLKCFWRQSRIRRLQNISVGGRNATCRGRGSFAPDVDDEEESATGCRFIQVVVSMIFVGYPCPEAMIQFDKFSAWSELKAPTRSFISIIVCHKSWFTGWSLEFVSTLRMVFAISLRLLAQLKGSYLHLLGKRIIILSLIWTLVQKPRQCHDPFVWEHFVLSNANVWEPRFHRKKEHASNRRLAIPCPCLEEFFSV